MDKLLLTFNDTPTAVIPGWCLKNAAPPHRPRIIVPMPQGGREAAPKGFDEQQAMARELEGYPENLERLRLAGLVYQTVFENTETFAQDGIGVDLAYLLGAITSFRADAGVDFPPYVRRHRPRVRPILRILRKHFPKNSPLWKFIKS